VGWIGSMGVRTTEKAHKNQSPGRWGLLSGLTLSLPLPPFILFFLYVHCVWSNGSLMTHLL